MRSTSTDGMGSAQSLSSYFNPACFLGIIWACVTFCLLKKQEGPLNTGCNMGCSCHRKNLKTRQLPKFWWYAPDIKLLACIFQVQWGHMKLKNACSPICTAMAVEFSLKRSTEALKQQIPFFFCSSLYTSLLGHKLAIGLLSHKQHTICGTVGLIWRFFFCPSKAPALPFASKASKATFHDHLYSASPVVQLKISIVAFSKSKTVQMFIDWYEV